METLSNKDIKLIRSRHEKKYRDQTGLFIVEGEKMVAEASASGFEIVQTVRRDEVGEALMGRLSACSSPSPVLAVVKKPLPASPGPEPVLRCRGACGSRQGVLSGPEHCAERGHPKLPDRLHLHGYGAPTSSRGGAVRQSDPRIRSVLLRPAAAVRSADGSAADAGSADEPTAACSTE